MKRVIDIDQEIKAKNFQTALKKFFAKHEELNYWKETFEYMFENSKDFFGDLILADGTKNINWGYALHLDINDNYYYFAIIERA